METAFLYIQNRVDFGIIQTVQPYFNISTIEMKVQRIPNRPFTEKSYDILYPAVKLGYMMIFMFLVFITRIVQDITRDTDTKMEVGQCS